MQKSNLQYCYSVHKHRYPELDLLRGLAVLSMIGYHAVFDLAYFVGWNIPLDIFSLQCWAGGTATLFLLLVGMCAMIAYERRPTGIFAYSLRRSTIIFGGGMVISLVTFFFAPEAFIKFGILHLIGISALLQPLFARFGRWNGVIGIFVIILGILMRNLTTVHPFLFPLGITTTSFSSLDYYPLFPWFGVILLGMAAGSWLYVPSRHSLLRWNEAMRFPQSLLWCGRNALLLYFIHQPVLLLILLMPRLGSA